MKRYASIKFTIYGDELELVELYNVLKDDVKSEEEIKSIKKGSIYYYYSKLGYDMNELNVYFKEDFNFIIDMVSINNGILEVSAYKSHGSGREYLEKKRVCLKDNNYYSYSYKKIYANYIDKLLEKFNTLKYHVLVIDKDFNVFYKIDINESFFKEKYYFSYNFTMNEEVFSNEKIYVNLNNLLDDFNNLFKTNVNNINDLELEIDNIEDEQEKYGITNFQYLRINKIANIVTYKDFEQLLSDSFNPSFTGKNGIELGDYLVKNNHQLNANLINKELDRCDEYKCYYSAFLPVYAARRINREITIFDFRSYEEQLSSKDFKNDFSLFLDQLDENEYIEIVIGGKDVNYSQILEYFSQEKFKDTDVKIFFKGSQLSIFNSHINNHIMFSCSIENGIVKEDVRKSFTIYNESKDSLFYSLIILANFLLDNEIKQFFDDFEVVIVKDNISDNRIYKM